ncbi:MAG: hypothetical protein K2Y20_06125, partial [Sphingomonas sp.]|nr:hypothetical protein [Sphingomonas sp.]
WDGFTNPKIAKPGICVQNGDAKVLNVDGPHKSASPHIDTGLNCAPATRLPAITLPASMTK